jgi:hypothetical protein
LGTELNEDTNECICKDSSLQDEETKLICKGIENNEFNEVEKCISINKRFYLHDKKKCIENGCPNDYYQFNFECYIDGFYQIPIKYLTKNVNQN